jgi:phenylpropionate dioxygenase-like ring-hydroxylating dioxygenase large terminal subunit
VTIEALRPSDFLGMVDASKGTVERQIFSDQEIYERELEHIFARAWNFMCHESQVPNTGDFFLTYIGEDRVIVVRDKNGDPRVLLNTCRHRGNAVCRAEEGHATSFMCTYHGWTYDLQGRLVGVPGFKDYYHEDLNREEWGLISAAKVAAYRGFIFATLDPQAPDLEDYLGDVGRIGLSLISAHGDVKVVSGIQKYTIGCNWKLAVDNLFDWYHPQISHASAMQTGVGAPKRKPEDPPPPPMDPNNNPFNGPNLVMLGEYGHAIGGPLLTPQLKQIMAMLGNGDPIFDQSYRDKPEAIEQLGPVGLQVLGHPNIFPNLWVASNCTQLSLRVPKGPHATEIWWFTLVDRNLPEETWTAQVASANHIFGPAGLLEQEDGENWDQSTRGTMGTVSRRFPLNFSMNRGRGEVIEDELGPPRIETNINEHPQLWTYRAWSEWMAADSWQELKANHSAVPSGKV